MTRQEYHSKSGRGDHDQRDHDFHQSETHRVALTDHGEGKKSNQECDLMEIAAQAKLVYFQQTQRLCAFLTIGSVTNNFWGNYFEAITWQVNLYVYWPPRVPNQPHQLHL